jgi:hypothetical protein
MECDLKESHVTYHLKNSTPLMDLCKNCIEQIFFPNCDTNAPCPYQCWEESGGGPLEPDEPDDDFPPEGI